MKHTQWKQLSKKVLLQHPRMTVSEDTVELPNGHQTSYIYIENGGESSLIMARDHEGKILVQREYSYPPNTWLYQFPGGKIEDHETPDDAASRELAEEADLQGSLTQIGWYFLDNRRKADKQYIYIADNLSNSSALGDIEEDIESYWFTEDEIDQLIISGKFVNFTALAAWAFYKAHKL